jgi:dihydrofolate reductase
VTACDEFQIMVNPIVLGNGTPLFKGLPQRAKLKLMNTRQFESGNVSGLGAWITG